MPAIPHDDGRWVFRRMFVVDGNFKADHVRQDRAAMDIWLSEGGGMDPKRAEYYEFILNAIERRTVSPSIHSIIHSSLTYGIARTHLVRIPSAPSRMRCLPRRHVTSPARSRLPVHGTAAMHQMLWSIYSRGNSKRMSILPSSKRWNLRAWTTTKAS